MDSASKHIPGNPETWVSRPIGSWARPRKDRLRFRAPNYYVGEPAADVSVQVYDGDKLINQLTGSGAVGLNRVEWGMTRREPRPEEERARWDEGQQYREADQEFFDYYDTVDFYGAADEEVTMDGYSMRTRVHDAGPTERDFRHFRVRPGEYTIVLTVGDLVMKRTARILADQWYDQ